MMNSGSSVLPRACPKEVCRPKAPRNATHDQQTTDFVVSKKPKIVWNLLLWGARALLSLPHFSWGGGDCYT
jgi:hypothetical protein